MKTAASLLALLAAAGLAFPVFAEETVPVNVRNFVRAETDHYHATYVDQGGLGAFVHIREPAPVDAQDIIRMNRDTLYSFGIFDLTEPVTISMPDAGDRFMSMQVVNQDHFVVGVEHEAGSYTFTEEEVGTRYMSVFMRIFMDETDAADISVAGQLQDMIEIVQADAGSFDVPNWDPVSLDATRAALLPLVEGIGDTIFGIFGTEEETDPLLHLIGTAVGWGGNPPEAAVYPSVTPEANDGTVPHSLTVGEVPVDGFWSVTVYDAHGFMVPNLADAYAINNVTADPNADGTVTVNFGACEDGRVNCLPIMEGWNYTVRLYQPQAEILDGSWIFPVAQAAENGS